MTTCTADIALPRYIPPTLHNNTKTSYRSQKHSFNHSNNWKEPLPHKDPSGQNLRHSHSLNWHTPSPNCPISFQSPSPPPQLSCASSVNPLPTLETPPIPQQYHPTSSLTLKLISIVRTTAEALRSITQ